MSIQEKNIKHTESLRISSRIEEINATHATIGVFQNGGKSGTLIVDRRFAPEIILLLSTPSRPINPAMEELVKASRDILDAFWDMSPLEYASSRKIHDKDGLPFMSDEEGEKIKQRLREVLAKFTRR